MSAAEPAGGISHLLIVDDDQRLRALLQRFLGEQGFRVTEQVADIPTAVMGEAGEGGPVIAILGEYDALPGLSQEWPTTLSCSM